MRILSIETNGFRSLEDRVYNLSDGEGAPHPLVAITGPASSGKTSLLDAIAAGKELCAPYGPAPASGDLIRPGLSECKISIEWWLDEDESSFAGVEGKARSEGIARKQGLPEVDVDPGLQALLERYSHYAGHGKVDYFPDDRAMPFHGVMVSDIVLDQQMQRLGRGPGKYGALTRFTRHTLNGTEDGRFAESIKMLFNRLCPWKKLVGINGVGMPVFHSSTGVETPLDRLSASEKMAFVLAGTIVMIGLHNSVVLLDTPELRFPAGDGERVLGELMAFAPSNQWIVATSDPGILAMAGPAQTLKLGAS